MSKHTKGPWKTYGSVVWSESKELNLSERTNRICLIGSNLRAPEAEKEANARLIAAAPELLDACKAILSVLGSSQIDIGCIDPSCKCEGNDEAKDAVDLLQAAVNKAKGGE